MLLTFHAEEDDRAAVDEATTTETTQESGLCTPPPRPPPRAPPPLRDGYRYSLRKQRRLARTHFQDLRVHPIDICFENPLDGAFKHHPGVVSLLKDAKGLVVRRETSYCHYGAQHRKRTLFVTSVLGFEPRLPCPTVLCDPLCGQPTRLRADLDPYAELQLEDFVDPVAPRTRHAHTLLDLGREERNRIPFALLKLLIYAWCDPHVKYGVESIQTYLVVDVFSGWGSLVQMVQAMHSLGKWTKIKVYSNDIVRRDHTDIELDMSSMQDPVSPLLRFALQQHAPLVLRELGTLSLRDALWKHRVALLVHFSTPCETYSVDGMATHRRRCETPHGTRYAPVTEAAKKADVMNARLIEWVRRECALVDNDETMTDNDRQ